MNTRCQYCGWSFSLSRDALETAVATALATNEKIHTERCPHCRKVIKMPVEQLRRALPPGWTPSAVEPDQPAAAEAEPVAEAVAAPVAAETTADEKPKRRRRGAHEASEAEAAPAAQETATKTKAPSGKSAAEKSAAKKTTRKQPKP
jgi:hypothetical protein